MAKAKKKQRLEIAAPALPASGCVPIYEALRKKLPKLPAANIKRELDALGLLRARFEGAYADLDDAPAWKEAALALLVAALDINKPDVIALRTTLTSAILTLNLPTGDEALLERYAVAKKTKAKTKSAAPRVHALDALLAWARTKANTESKTERARHLEELLGAAMAAPSRPKETGGKNAPVFPFEALDDHLTKLVSADSAKRDFVQSLAPAAWISRTPKLARALDQSLVPSGLTLRDLIASLDDRSLSKTAHVATARRILEIREESLADASATAAARLAIEAILARRSRMPRALVESAFRSLSGAEAFELLSPELTRAAVSEDLCKRLIECVATLRDPRWFSFIVDDDSARGDDLPVTSMVIAIASDPENPSRDDALALLLKREKEARHDVVGRRWAIENIGKAGHAGAVPALVAAIKDRHIGSAMALTLHALSLCATPETIPFLKTRLKKSPTWTSYIEDAIATIEKRARQLSRERILASCDHPDKTLADLARAALDGDVAATAVLEDALRERGELPT